MGQLELPAIRRHLQGLLAWRGGDYAKAAVKFQDNLRDKTEWTVAWFGWLLCEFALGHADVVIQDNLQLNGVKLLPYSPADESAFIALSQGDRDDLVGQFQSAMRGIGDLYAASGLVQSRAQVSQSREEYRQAA